LTPKNRQKEHIVATVLWIIAVIIGIFGVLRLIRGDILVGIALIVVAFLVGPGGVSIFT
jgi:TM2 domain-containing membrane protein YozV